MGRGEDPEGTLQRGVAFLTAWTGVLSQRREFCLTSYFPLSQAVITVTISLSSDLPALHSLASLLSVNLESRDEETKEEIWLCRFLSSCPVLALWDMKKKELTQVLHSVFQLRTLSGLLHTPLSGQLLSRLLCQDCNSVLQKPLFCLHYF